MAHYIDADKIRAEIEMRITDNTFGAKLELIDILAWLDTLESEKPMQEDLNDEIKKFIEEYGYEKGADKLLIAIVARHFAEWQKSQDDRLVDIIYQQGIEKGKDEMKEKAIEGHLFRYPPFTNPLISVSGINPEAFTNGDTRVKLIIIKENEE